MLNHGLKSNISVLDEWVDEIHTMVNSKIRILNTKIKKTLSFKKCFNYLYAKYVLEPADKGANNDIII